MIMMKNIQLAWELVMFAITFSVKNEKAKRIFFLKVQSVLWETEVGRPKTEDYLRKQLSLYRF